MSDSIKQRLGRLIREMGVYCDHYPRPRPKGRTVAVFPSYDRSTGSSLLRGWLVGKELRQQGWGVTIMPSQLVLSQRMRLLERIQPDLILLQKQRHKLNRPRYYDSYMCVYDLDDADYLDEAARGAVVECCSESTAVIAGSRFIADWCQQYNPQVSIVWTGTPYLPPLARPAGTGGGIVAWASSSPLQNPAEFEFVESFLHRLSQECRFEFWLYGIDTPESIQGFRQRIQARGVTVRTLAYMGYAELIDSLSQVTVGLAPLCGAQTPYSRGKSFGKVLAYLASRIPVIASDEADHALFFVHGQNGFVTNDMDEWVRAAKRLLDDADFRKAMIEHAEISFRDQLTTQAAAAKVGAVLEKVLNTANQG